MIDWSRVFAEALPYASFLEQFANASQQDRWQAMHSRISLTVEERNLLSGFSRRMPVLCLAGTWCGDCVNQCPVFDHFSKAAPQIDLRFLDRHAIPEVRSLLAINGGHRRARACIPQRRLVRGRPLWRAAAFDLSPNDRRISRSVLPYRINPAAGRGLSAMIADWLSEFERFQLILRLSPRLRARYGD